MTDNLQQRKPHIKNPTQCWGNNLPIIINKGPRHQKEETITKTGEVRFQFKPVYCIAVSVHIQMILFVELFNLSPPLIELSIWSVNTNWRAPCDLFHTWAACILFYSSHFKIPASMLCFKGYLGKCSALTLTAGAQLWCATNPLPRKVEDRGWHLRFLLEAIIIKVRKQHWASSIKQIRNKEKT